MLVQIYLDRKQSVSILAYAFSTMGTKIPLDLFRNIVNVQFRYTQGESFNIGVQIPVFIYAILTKELSETDYYASLENKQNIDFIKNTKVN